MQSGPPVPPSRCLSFIPPSQGLLSFPSLRGPQGRSNPLPILLTLLLTPLTPPTFAQSASTPASTPAPTPPEPQRVEIKASELSDTEQRRREPVAKSVYGREELDKYGDVSVTDVLKRLPGINLQGGNPRFRGLGAGYTLILINGEPAPPGFSLENLSPSQVERIEVTKGPSPEHSAQAVAGTINFILRAAPRQRLREVRLGLGYTLVRPVANLNATYGDRWGDVGVSLPFSAYGWHGGNESQSERLARDVNLDPQHLAIQSVGRWWGSGMSFGPRLQWKWNENHALEWQTFVQNHRFHSRSASSTEVFEGTPPPSVRDSSLNGGYWQMLRTGLQWTRRFAQGQRLEIKAGLQASGSEAHTDTDGDNAAGQRTVVRRTTSEAHEQSQTTSGKFTFPWADSQQLAVGWDVEGRRRQEERSVIENGAPQLVGFEGEPFHARIGRLAFWAQDEWEISSQWSTSLGLRAERLHTQSRSSMDQLSHVSQVISPMVHVNFKIDPKGRDLIRASITRSYRAPDLSRLMARPSISTAYPIDKPNPEISPDRVGNPALQPELSLGMDLAFEKYFSPGGVFSVGLFRRDIKGLVRNALSFGPVPWASAPRWVSRPVNLDHATSSGLEMEVKGRLTELWPQLQAPVGLSLRSALSFYRSKVDGIPGPDNRLESQQPWSWTAGFDHQWAGSPLGFGGNLAFTPQYGVQQTVEQHFEQMRTRNVDVYMTWAFSREAILRASVNNLWPSDTVNRTTLTDVSGLLQGSFNRSTVHTNFNVNLTLKF
ncbi:MAG: hypothetical protein RI949_1148 [Pseudomonadota bacterium]